MKVANSILELIGKTPLVRVGKINTGKADLLLKLEYFNPTGSVKDRPALSMIEDAEARGILKPGALVIEPTSGNTGIGLALVCAIKGYKLILTMPETMSIERRKLLASYGAELVLTEGSKGMTGAVQRANELKEEHPGSFIPGQFDNPSNVKIHYDTTANEIWEDTDGKVDIVVSGVGTGGTATGVAKRLKELKPSVKVYAVEPEESPVLSGGKPGPHKIQGIGAGFVPKIYDAKYIDEVIKISAEESGKVARALAKEEGVHAGVSSGAALKAALELSDKKENAGKTIVVIIPDSGARYLSTWLYSND